MGSLGSGVRSPAAARGGPQRWLPPQAASLPTQLRAGLFNLLGGLVCRITAFLAKDRAVRKDEVDTILGRQEGFVLSESCGSSCLWDDVFDGHLGFPGHLLANVRGAMRTGGWPRHKSTDRRSGHRTSARPSRDLVYSGPLTPIENRFRTHTILDTRRQMVRRAESKQDC